MRVTVTIKQDNLYVFEDKTFFYAIDMDAVADAFSQLAAGNYIIDSDYSEDHFTGTITTTAEASVVQTTIPYDEGWTVLVDGEPVEIYKTLDALIAFDTTPGTHTLELKYEPKAFTYGMICTIVSTVIFIALCILEPIWRRRHPMRSAQNGAEEELYTLEEIAAELNDISVPIVDSPIEDNKENL